MIILSIIEIAVGVLLLIFAQKLSDKIFINSGNKGLVGSIFRILSVFLVLSGVVLFILNI